MEKRTLDYYDNCPAMLRFCLEGENGNHILPEIIALALAMREHKNVTLRSEYTVRMFGKVSNPPASNPNVQFGDVIRTSRIKGIYSEKIYGDGDNRFDTIVQTANTNYLVWPEEHITMMYPLKEVFKKINQEGLKFEDYTEFFSDINENYPEYEFCK